MFGTLRRFAASVASVVNRLRTGHQATAPAPVRRYPVITARHAARLRYAAALAAVGMSDEHHYPYRSSRRKTKGQRDRSLTIRSNRRKAR